MRIGVVLPQTEIGADPGALRAYATRITELGFTHILAYDHVVGADPAVHQGWSGPYDVHTTFHEPFVLYGYLAAVTQVELVTGIIILPQRQTALVAKQAAEVDILTGGRFRLGVGLGWNPVEYEALGQRFDDRGRRMSEQIDLLRQLWTEPTVTYRGDYERVTGAGLAPMPVQRPIPIWIGGHADAALNRAARLGDGHIFAQRPETGWAPLITGLRERVAEAGRDPAAFGVEVRLGVQRVEPDLWLERAEEIREAGATHLSLDSMRGGLDTPEAHLERLVEVLELIRR